jgi:hypothetical protein
LNPRTPLVSFCQVEHELQSCVIRLHSNFGSKKCELETKGLWTRLFICVRMCVCKRKLITEESESQAGPSICQQIFGAGDENGEITADNATSQQRQQDFFVQGGAHCLYVT